MATVFAAKRTCTHTDSGLGGLEKCITTDQDPNCQCETKNDEIKGVFKRRDGKMCIVCGKKCPTDERWAISFSSQPCTAKACICDKWQDRKDCSVSTGMFSSSIPGMYCAK